MCSQPLKSTPIKFPKPRRNPLVYKKSYPIGSTLLTRAVCLGNILPVTGTWQSGQLHQTVNLTRDALQRFESFRAHHIREESPSWQELTRIFFVYGVLELKVISLTSGERIRSGFGERNLLKQQFAHYGWLQNRPSARISRFSRRRQITKLLTFSYYFRL